MCFVVQQLKEQEKKLLDKYGKIPSAKPKAVRKSWQEEKKKLNMTGCATYPAYVSCADKATKIL